MRVDPEGAQHCTVMDTELASLAFPKPAPFWSGAGIVLCIVLEVWNDTKVLTGVEPVLLAQFEDNLL